MKIMKVKKQFYSKRFDLSLRPNVSTVKIFCSNTQLNFRYISTLENN